MKTVYQVHQDGCYTNITKHNLVNNLANELLNDEYSDHYKTFTKAKRVALGYVTDLKDQYTYAVKGLRSLKESELEEPSNQPIY